jgi:hypothetical protein
MAAHGLKKMDYNSASDPVAIVYVVDEESIDPTARNHDTDSDTAIYKQTRKFERSCRVVDYAEQWNEPCRGRDRLIVF